MKTTLQLLILFLFIQPALSQIITVKQDSTGDYTSIQEAVDASSNGDTVLVWPGTYYENIDMNLHNITLASLDLTTGEPQHKYNTIIDGSNNKEACLWTLTFDTEFTIQGFTLQNGSGHEDNFPGSTGGGLHIVRADVSVINCIIRDNFASKYGGGIYSVFTNLYLSGTVIKNNHAGTDGGGGILFSASTNNQYTIEFDTINLCSIFDNYAFVGADFKTGKSGGNLTIQLDTFSVSQPGRQHIYATKEGIFPDDRISVEMKHYMRESVNADLYVNSEGDDTNSGLTADEPLKSLTKAVQLIVSDSVQKNTIHLANGTYAPSTTGEHFPVGLFTNISIIGQSRDSTILDAEHFTHHMEGPRLEHSFNLKHMSLINGMGDNSGINVGSFFLVFNDTVSIEDVRFSNNTGIAYSSGVATACSNTTFRDVLFENNIGGKTVRVSTMYQAPEFPRLTDSVFFENCIFRHNMPNPDSAIGYGGAFLTTSIFEDFGPDSLITILSNCLFENNETDNGNYSGNIIGVYESSRAVFSNCTFADNSVWGQTDYSSIFYLGGYWSKAHIYNSIFYGGYPREMHISQWDDDYPVQLWVYNTLLAGGYEGIGGDVEVSDVIYDQTNIDSDPLFLGKWEHPYQIDNGSPCIDAGTLANLPDFIELPETDLAGNPRIVGDSIDMGAYEWNPTVGVDEYIYRPIKNKKPKLLQAAPNPFARETTISAQWDFSGHVQIEIYNNAGLRVKVLKSGASGPGSIQTRWDGKDQNGNILPAGIYHVVMFWEGKEVEGIKILKTETDGM